MDYIRINVKILGRYPGIVIDESDVRFDVFKAWAKNKDRNGGRVICDFCDAPEKTEENKDETADGQESGSEEGTPGNAGTSEQGMDAGKKKGKLKAIK